MISAHQRSRSSMSETTGHMSISLDGFVAGPDQSLEHPLGRRGIELHHWHLDEPLHDADARARDLLLRPRGAADPRLEPVEVIHSPLATHVRYRVGR
jgi:hypothetical protein